MKLEIACSFRSRLRGLGGKESFDGMLLLVPCRDVHTFTMKRAIDVAFVDEGGTVVEAHRRVAPRRRLRNRRAVATLERFSTDGPWLEQGDSIEIGSCADGSVSSSTAQDQRDRSGI